MPEDQLRRVRPRVNHDVEIVAQEENEEDDLEDRGEGDVRDELVEADAATEGPLAACFGGEVAKFADIVNEDTGVDAGGDGVVGESSGEGDGCGEADGAGGDRANNMAEVVYVGVALCLMMAVLVE